MQSMVLSVLLQNAVAVFMCIVMVKNAALHYFSSNYQFNFNNKAIGCHHARHNFSAETLHEIQSMMTSLLHPYCYLAPNSFDWNVHTPLASLHSVNHQITFHVHCENTIYGNRKCNKYNVYTDMY